MRDIRLLIGLFSLVLFTGCASQMVWYQEGKSLSECEQAWKECRFEAVKHGYVQASPFGDPIASGAVAGVKQAFRENDIMRACMDAKGYRLLPKSQVEQMGGQVKSFR